MAILLTVVLTVVYRLVLLASRRCASTRMGGVAKDAEVLVLRHQLAVRHRQVARPRFSGRIARSSASDLACMVPPESLGGVPRRPNLPWHRALVRRHWTDSHRRPERTSPIGGGVLALIVRLARETSAGPPTYLRAN